ncbi:MAG TPA: TetR family transcriptional regulator C-terminal domain-containing protein [Steroidobacteraceae bacterium]|jgi:TetR/AcrR family transcriptional regulator|nr:TetR family transcriptional regulator C-terminal domain-containing protein [Steroidobacteraceae bacterium]
MAVRSKEIAPARATGRARAARKQPAAGSRRRAALASTGRKGRTRKSRSRADQQAAIIAAAERVFAGAGFGGATMQAIAAAAGLPKPNLHYYFGSKKALYQAVLERTLREWLAPADTIVAEAEPREALECYIREKMRQSFTRPYASRVWANELLHGAPELRGTLVRQLRPLVRRKAAVIDQWIAQGRMAPLDSMHLFFTIWAATQTYADFEVQICTVLGHDALDLEAQARATQHVVSLILRGCGLV